MHISLLWLARRWLALVVLILFSTLAYSTGHSNLTADVEHSPAESGYVRNQLIVKLRNGGTIGDVEAINRVNGVAHTEKIVHGRASSPDLDRLYLLEFSSIVNVWKLVATYESNPYVEYAEPNFIYALDVSPNDPEFSRLWGLHNTGQFGGIPGSDIDAPEGWGIATDANQTLVGVIDSGVNYNHPDLAANMWRNPGEVPNNNVDDDGNGFVDDYYGYDFSRCLKFNPPGTVCTVTKLRDSDPMDDTGHGTHVAGTIGAVGNNGLGVTGVSWNGKIMAIKALTPAGGLTSDLIDAVNYATMMNVTLTNNSWGGGGFSQGLLDAIKAARDAGILFVAAAGNGGSDGIGDNNESDPHYPSSYNLENIIAVAATDMNDKLATFSNFGATSVDLAAPGDLILSTWYRVDPSFADVTFDSTAVEGIPMEFSPATSASGITATAQYAGLGYPGDFVGSFAGKIAVIQRGEITFGEKVSNAMDAGAIGAVIYNNVDGMFSGTLGSAGSWIPTASISKSDGEFLVAQLPRTVTFKITASSYVYLSGTSMSTPHVSGAGALLRQQLPAASYSEIKSILLSTTDALPSLAGKMVTGGRLNLFSAMNLNLFHDLAVPSVGASRSFAYNGVSSQPVKVEVTVANQGSVGETSTVTARAGTSIIGSSPVTVAAGASTIVTFNWDAHLFPLGTYPLSAEVSQVTGETDLLDNSLTSGTFTVRFAGDVNNDCTVNVSDLAKLGAAFLKAAGQPGFDPDADLNQDGIINVQDLAIIGSEFLKTC